MINTYNEDSSSTAYLRAHAVLYQAARIETRENEQEIESRVKRSILDDGT